MSVYKDKNKGTWYVKYTIEDLPTGTKKRTTKRGFKTAKAAKEWEHKAHTKVEPGTSKTLEELAAEWEANNQPSEETIRHYNECVKFRLYNLKKKRIDDISKVDLLKWRTSLGMSSYSTKTKNDTVTFLNGVLKFAAMIYGVSDMSSVLKRFKKTDEDVMKKKDMNVWTPDEFEHFLSYVYRPIYRDYFTFLFRTGCRRGEAIALQKSDVHGSFVYICYSQRTVKEGLKPTKTRQNRWVAMDDKLAEIVNRLAAVDNNSNYVFTYNNKPLCPSPIDFAFKKAIEKSGLKPIRIHDLRHSHASWLIGNGINIVAVSKRLGHASVEQTLTTYTHLIPAADEAMTRFLNKN